jgi:hypothetical protein
MQQVFVWSSTSFQVVAQYSIEDPYIWFLNVNCPSLVPDRTVITPVFEPSRRISSSCVLFKGWCPNLTESVALLDMDMISQATGTAPLLSSDGSIWFRGREILMIPRGFRDPKSCLIDLSFLSTSPSAPRGRSPRDRFANLDSRSGFTLPAAKDGRQSLICDEKVYR